MQRLLKPGFPALIFLTLASCHQASSSRLQTFSIPGGIAQRLELGQAYDSHRAKHGNVVCVKGERTATLLEPRATIHYSRDMSYESLLKSISGELSAGVSFPTVSVDANADYASENSSTEFRETHSLFFRYSAKEKYHVGTVELSDKGELYAKAGATKARERCRNEFVNEIDWGGLFNANLTMEFKNSKDKEKFGGSMKIDVLAGAVKVEGALKSATEKEKQSVKIRLSALQQGGDPQRLASVFSADLASCNANNLDPCLEAFKQLILYGKTMEQQLQDRDKLVALAYHTESYADTGLEGLVPEIEESVDPLVEETRLALEQQLEIARGQDNRIDMLLATYVFTLPTEKLNALKQQQRNVHSNLGLLNADLIYCYQYPYAKIGSDGVSEVPCRIRFEKTQLSLKSIDNSLLEMDQAPDEGI